MEKLVRRHYRKEPGHLACRVGPIVCTLLLSLVAFSNAGAQSYGNPAKVVRINPRAPVVRDSSAIVVREQPAMPATPVVEVAVSLPTETAPPSKPASKPAPIKKRARGPMVSSGPYLPITGALPLRYSSSRDWPAPMPVGEPPAEELLPQAIAAAAGSEDTWPAEAVATTTSSETVANVASAAAAASAAVTKITPEPTVLTADMILSYLGTMPSSDARVFVRFEPAIPQGASDLSR